MALHELATNAAKYGALSNSDGTVRITWQITADAKPQFLMSWLEDGGPKVVAPARAGFGQIVIGRMAEASVQGVAKIEYGDAGLSWNLSAPLKNVLT
jgi:two-component sensor histidine kinase